MPVRGWASELCSTLVGAPAASEVKAPPTLWFKASSLPFNGGLSVPNAKADSCPHPTPGTAKKFAGWSSALLDPCSWWLQPCRRSFQKKTPLVVLCNRVFVPNSLAQHYSDGDGSLSSRPLLSEASVLQGTGSSWLGFESPRCHRLHTDARLLPCPGQGSQPSECPKSQKGWPAICTSQTGWGDAPKSRLQFRFRAVPQLQPPTPVWGRDFQLGRHERFARLSWEFGAQPSKRAEKLFQLLWLWGSCLWQPIV